MYSKFLLAAAAIALLSGCATSGQVNSKEAIRQFSEESFSEFEAHKINIVDIDGYDVCNERPLSVSLKEAAKPLCKEDAVCLKKYENKDPDVEIFKLKSDASKLFGVFGLFLSVATGDVIGSGTTMVQDIIPNAETVPARLCAKKTYIRFNREDGKELMILLGNPWYEQVPYKSLNDFKNHEEFVYALVEGEIEPKRLVNQKNAYMIVTKTKRRGELDYIVIEEELEALKAYKAKLTKQASN